MEDVDIDAVDISTNARNLPLRDFLKQIADQANIAVVFHDRTVRFTSKYYAEYALLTRVYEVTDLVSVPSRNGMVQFDFDTLIDVIVATLSPDSWEDVGGAASIQGFPGNHRAALVVSQTEDNHKLLESLLNAQRRALGLQLPANPDRKLLTMRTKRRTRGHQRRVKIGRIGPQVHE